jgi:hypothetical protein
MGHAGIQNRCGGPRTREPPKDARGKGEYKVRLGNRRRDECLGGSG